MPSDSALPLGAHADAQGVHFAVAASMAEQIELCLFDPQLQETQRLRLPHQTHGIWHGYAPGLKPGQVYGYRAHGPYQPERGLRHNPAKLLIDPYARAMRGSFQWHRSVFDFDPDFNEWRINTEDSAAFVPKCVVTSPASIPSHQPAPRDWSDSVIYETNVRGFTMRHPDISEADRGRFRGLSNGRIVAYLKALGITTIELMPVHALLDEMFLARTRRRNLWGYNSINFFCADARFAVQDAAAEFRDMVNALHDAGLEVLLDVVFNHTGEGGPHGPSLSFRGLDNTGYYRTDGDHPDHYVDFSGCGNTLNSDQPRVRALIVDALKYWHQEMAVDGFRFDLAVALGRTGDGFDPQHPLLASIANDPALTTARLIAEPWDTGPEGYQLGRFPSPWSEWNDQYRDTVRRFWRSDPQLTGAFAQRIHGSSVEFERSGRAPAASINCITCHDGFTLADLVAYQKRHNLANGENNRDGHAHNFSCNHGVEGPTDDAAILARRRLHRLNLLATLLFSQGTPMLLAGDELGNGQDGNNNAYAQDNETGWLDWQGLEADPDFLQQVRSLIQLRRDEPLLRHPHWLHQAPQSSTEPAGIAWLDRQGQPIAADDWAHTDHFMLWLTTTRALKRSATALVLVFTNHPGSLQFDLPPAGPGLDNDPGWLVRFDSCTEGAELGADNCLTVTGPAVVLCSTGRQA